jgi:hypothetical protein
MWKVRFAPDSSVERAYEAAWARLQHEEPGYAADPADQLFERVLIDWLRFHKGMLIGEIIPQVYHNTLRDNPAVPEFHLYDHILVDEYQDLNRAEQGTQQHAEQIVQIFKRLVEAKLTSQGLCP